MNSGIRLARRAVMFELALYWSLLRWVSWRPHVPAGTRPFRYVGAVAPLLWAFIGVSALELVVLHLILPWAAVRITVDVLSVWGLVWMLGLMASFRVYPHLVARSGLRIRHGFGTDITVPWDAVAGVAVRERGRERSRTVQLDRDDRGTLLHVVVASRTNVDVTFRRPVDIPLPGGTESVNGLRFFADDARELADRVRGLLAAGDGAHR